MKPIPTDKRVLSRRNVLKALALAGAAALCPVAVTAVPDDEPTSLLHFYRLNAQGCHPKRVRMHELRKGDLFLVFDPVNKCFAETSICRATDDPRQVEAPNGHYEKNTWYIVYEQV